MFLGRSSLKRVHRIEFGSIINSGCHGNKIQFFKQFFKILLVWNHWFHRNVFWVTLFKNCFQNFDLHKHGSGEWGLPALYWHDKILWNRWSDSEIISQECCFGDPFQKLFAKIWPVLKYGSGEWGLLSLNGHEEFLKESSLKPQVRFWNNFTGMFLG